MACQLQAQEPLVRNLVAGERPPREEFAGHIQALTRLLLRIDRPYLALCLRQFELMALAVWPQTDPPQN